TKTLTVTLADTATGRATNVSGTATVSFASFRAGGFELPAVGAGFFGAFQYGPSGTGRSYANGAGGAGKGSGFAPGNPPAPEGTQVAFLQSANSSASQTFTAAAGTYRVSFRAAQRAFQPGGGAQQVRVLVDGTDLGTFTPAGAAYQAFATPALTLSDGVHPLSLVGLPAGDNTAFIDNVQINAVPPAATEFALPTANSVPDGITREPDGNLWFTEFTSNKIGRITPAGEVTEFSQGLSPGGNPSYITAGPDGNLWFTEASTGRIGRITPAGVITEFAIPNAAGQLAATAFGITAGPDGNLRFTEPSGAIGRITTAAVATLFG